MSPEQFPPTFRLVLAVFLVQLFLVQYVTFRELAGAGADPDRRAARHVRDHVVGALCKAAAWGVGVAGIGSAAWAWTVGRGEAGTLLWGAEFFLAALVLSVGLAALAARLSLQVLERGGSRSRVRWVRAAVLGAGILYAVALWARGRAEPGEHLLAFFVLGAALLVLGLNRLAGLSSATLEGLVPGGAHRNGTSSV